MCAWICLHLICRSWIHPEIFSIHFFPSFSSAVRLARAWCGSGIRFSSCFFFFTFCRNENIANNWAYLSYTGTICGHSITHGFWRACRKISDSIPRTWKLVWIMFNSLDCRSSLKNFIFWNSGSESHEQWTLNNQKSKYLRFGDKENSTAMCSSYMNSGHNWTQPRSPKTFISKCTKE